MRIQIESSSDMRGAPQRLYRGERRIDIIEMIDQWYGPGYRYIKDRGHDNSVYILRFDEVSHQGELIMFSVAPAQEYCVNIWREAEGNPTNGAPKNNSATHRHSPS
jgi:hypothetical protein